ncbi:MAG: PAS domain-containing hybrid sensor histidine kinase/response regulator [Xanthomonadaceae bacterium]|nr:PAS domain-containing hybrid sensor histidine kinase/response regulator [Xanthomonadaceae bacterium]MDP2185254.1 PAS domain-containing hybrid sensor histidine kinase/response regulator [Xanthomonadales bacterium]MDZ4117061.1 PAS domain-containing hybrid sensor histidine kinase/response regulator [Xanthomonadaceae bacterium]MDZ4379289.1 PAS domain-containing hybrid sensor histidine kinase/response regulator [Xanthomonadaceae bacterium]
MIAGWILLLVSLMYVGLLFGVAWFGDRKPLYPQHHWLRPLVYSLALAVYCSSWTFYGAVGTAANDALAYLPIYLGPILLMLFAWRVLERMALVAREQNIVSIADFISSRYGRAQHLAALVSLIALVAAVPYLALQFKAVAMSVDVLIGTSSNDAGLRSVLSDPALYVALMLAVFSILFGTRQIDATEHHHGMMLAIALESLVKLVVFVAIGIFAVTRLPGSGDFATRAVDSLHTFAASELPRGFVAQTLLAFTAIICLPRQFQVAVVECEEPGDVRRARWLFTGYLLMICLMVPPITLAGQALLGASGTPGDSYVLALPMAEGFRGLALAVYIGGLSAATGMVIVASVALATMVSNDLVMPLLLRSTRLRPSSQRNFGRLVLIVRRVIILVLALVAYGYHRATGGAGNLAAFGLLAFVAVAQFAPALIGALYWRGGSRAGVEAGLIGGFLVWIYTLVLPMLTRAGWLAPEWLLTGPFGLSWLRPEALFGVIGWDAITHGTFWSLLLNIGTFLVVSARYRPSFDEQMRATPFLDPYARRPPLASASWQGRVSAADLLALAGRIVGERNALRAFEENAKAQGKELTLTVAADRVLVQFTERLLAGAIGAASARVTLTSALRGSGMELGEVVAMLDEASQELRFNRELLSTTIENIPQAVSVVDRDLRLVAWNRRYQALFEYPDGMLYVGRAVADLIRYNAERGELGPGDIDAQVDKRVAYLRQGSAHVSERVRPNGQVIELRGQPLPAGGYVSTYTDISEYKRVEQALRVANETLEARVEQRTHELAEALSAQAQARQDADFANESKTRFLAALSHDVLQPLNAARLFASALRESDDSAEQHRLAERVDTALRAAEDLLDGLLDISRLDAGALTPQWQSVSLDALMDSVAEQYQPLAQARNLDFHVHRCGLAVHADRRLLRRVIQNFVANALRYTPSGRVVLGCRRHPTKVDIEVWDTGPGIPLHHLQQIFEEFSRLDQSSPWGERGLGLGLSICQRISRVLDAPIRVRSQVGHGSVFSICVARATRMPARPPTRAVSGDGLAGLRVLCVDNDREILDGMQALLTRWQVQVETAETIDEALARAVLQQPQVFLVDYHLHDRADGLAALDALRAVCGDASSGALLTADGSDALKQRARAGGYVVLTKPIKPAMLRAFLAAQQVS